jgi:hypothetical protein
MRVARTRVARSQRPAPVNHARARRSRVLVLVAVGCSLMFAGAACSKQAAPSSSASKSSSPSASTSAPPTPSPTASDTGSASSGGTTATATAGHAMPTYTVSVKNFTYSGMPSAVPANKPFLVSFTNKESFSIVHEFVVVRVPKGKTADDVVADAKKKGDKSEDDWVHVGDSGDVETGGSVLIPMDLAPGNYVAACWQTGKAGGGSGPPHIAIGMHSAFTAS